MYAYQVDFTAWTPQDPKWPSMRHAAGETPKEALVAVFDELTDMGIEVTSFGAIRVEVDNQWILVHPMETAEQRIVARSHETWED